MQKISSSSFKNVIYEMYLEIIYIYIYIYKGSKKYIYKDLVLNDLQRLTCYETKQKELGILNHLPICRGRIV